MPNTKPPPPDTHVHLVLHRGKKSDFYLEIPVSVVADIVLKPFKFLRYLGWSVLGVGGDLLDGEDMAVDLESTELIARSTYRYRRRGDTDDPFEFAIDLEVIKQRSGYSCSSARNAIFRQSLETRDSRGDDGEVFNDFDGIDDARNGILVTPVIHGSFDHRQLVILKTPNPMLQPEDVVQPAATVSNPNVGIEYPPDGSRYTLQWTVPSSNPMDFFFVPKTADARFVIGTEIPRPSDLLLHYNYGAAAVKYWGRNGNILVDERPNIPRPKLEESASTKPPYKRFGRDAFSNKRAGRGEGEVGGSNFKEPGGPVEDAGREWDEDDVMLFLWGNTPQAMSRCMNEGREKKSAIDQWRLSVGVE
ncbi:hypothetical protein BU17DRAFT_60537 [Hysterangium stoloniferum]|nr:hypothetical protein BU17DRAFT_60537 [Hysterangium stoloniferum]